MRTLKTTLTSLCFLLTLFSVNTFAQDFPYITLLGTGNVADLAFSPDGKTLASSGEHGTILWNVGTGSKLHTFQEGVVGDRRGHGGEAFSPDGKTTRNRS